MKSTGKTLQEAATAALKLGGVTVACCLKCKSFRVADMRSWQQREDGLSNPGDECPHCKSQNTQIMMPEMVVEGLVKQARSEKLP